MYVIGGWDGFLRPIKSVEMLERHWTVLPDLNLARSSCSSCVTDEALLVAGGFDGKERMKSIEKYNGL